VYFVTRKLSVSLCVFVAPLHDSEFETLSFENTKIRKFRGDFGKRTESSNLFWLHRS
jgi:hypothetical protein